MAVFVPRNKATPFFPNKLQPSNLLNGTSTATQVFFNINLGSFGFSKVKNYVVEDSGPIFGRGNLGNGSSTLLRLSVIFDRAV